MPPTSDPPFGHNPAAVPRGKRYLLAIGINEYENGFATLNAPEKDVETLVETLVHNYNFEEGNVKKLCGKMATKDGIISAIAEIKKGLMSEDTLVVFFAGHGAAEKKPNSDDFIGYWITYDGKPNLPLNYRISTVLEDLIGCCSQVLLIADCCFAGALSTKATREAIFSNPKEGDGHFYVLTSSKNTTAPDDSLFFKTLMQILEEQDIHYFSQLRFMLEDKLGDTITASESRPQTTLNFVFKRSDNIKNQLKAVCYDINYELQKYEKLPDSIFKTYNLIYLHGTKECAHHLFIRFLFNELNSKENASIYTHIPSIIKLKALDAKKGQKIWHFFKQFIKDSTQLNQDITQLIVNMTAADSRVFILRIDESFSQDAELSADLMELWEILKKIGSMPTKNTDQNFRFYFIVLDERGEAAEVDPSVIEPERVGEDSLISFGSIQPINIKKFEGWHSRKQIDDLPKFAMIPIADFADLHVANAVLKICEACGYGSVADEVLLTKR